MVKFYPIHSSHTNARLLTIEGVRGVYLAVLNGGRSVLTPKFDGPEGTGVLSRHGPSITGPVLVMECWVGRSAWALCFKWKVNAGWAIRLANQSRRPGVPVMNKRPSRL